MLQVSQTDVAPVIDGVIDDQWDVGHVSSIALNFGISEHRRAPAEQTEVRVLADQQALCGFRRSIAIATSIRTEEYHGRRTTYKSKSL
jgi:hypothetical protein